MIAQYEDPERDPLLAAPRLYGLGQAHKHLPEMAAVCGLSAPPVFCPVVAPYYAGMEVIVTLTAGQLSCRFSDLPEIYASYYGPSNGPVVSFIPSAEESGFLSASAYSGRDDMEITVCGNPDRILLISRFDNLGKGASGAAIQNLNLVLGLEETLGLALKPGGNS